VLHDRTKRRALQALVSPRTGINRVDRLHQGDALPTSLGACDRGPCLQGGGRYGATPAPGLARRLEDRHPSAAASVREGLEETLTILTLRVSDRLRQSLATTNAIESLISRTRHVRRNVKRWRGGQMVLRWTAVAILEAVKAFVG
jgi:hypothetical protein